MKVGTARSHAADWVRLHSAQESGFVGAYFSGSTVALPEQSELPAASDVDIVIVLDQADPPLKLGKFIYQGVLLEVTYLSSNLFTSAEEVLASYHLAGSFRVDTLIADPSGRLRILQGQVAAHFAEMAWVRRRCDDARQKIVNGLQSIDPSAPLHTLVTSWLFPTGITTHVLLVAALRNPTVRLRYLAAREVLQSYGHIGLYPDLLSLLGCTHLTAEQVEHHLHQLIPLFDTAAAVSTTPFFFRSDIAPAARSIAIDGSLELIRSGHHREAVFWIVATYARCLTILAADAPNLQQPFQSDFEAVIADLGLTSREAILKRAEAVLDYVPELWTTTEAILAANERISD
ncbi:hypothetical protein [Paenibacillus rigui]|uniref:Polymerase nucleotidyl transferase domain-containing protein n=1 Tax=Paenibacillus rigui TaxID=554312 RepID=A0A229UJ69_9BACL|nr:hypothetical protein [Paenibacillus rigui]OXM83430.1 hypothetical protein CF651_25820 [Paenibacillus rigui]